MGQCVTIEVNSGKKDASHSGIKQQHASHKAVKNQKRSKLHQDEASASETSDDGGDLEMEAGDKFVVDENFGKQQSPINIITCSGAPNCYELMSDSDFKANPLKFHYPDEVRGCTIINTGHTVQVNIPSHSKCSLTRNGKTYNLVQFHFHTPSEHMIDSKQYEMEMHLVHATEEGELAVLGFIFTTRLGYFKRHNKLTNARAFLVNKTKEIIANFGKDNEHPVHQHAVYDEEVEEEEQQDDEDVVTPDGFENMDESERRRSSVRQLEGNDFLDQFWDELPLKKTTEEIRLSKPISFDYLFEAASKTFKKSVETNEITIDMEIFEYAGSLTTPPYSEGVSWMVARGLHFINAKQLNKLSSCWGHHNNARECQQYHGRAVALRTGADMKGYFFN